MASYVRLPWLQFSNRGSVSRWKGYFEVSGEEKDGARGFAGQQSQGAQTNPRNMLLVR